MLKEMECSVCRRMRYRVDDTQTSAIGAWLWGDPCACPAPLPPNMWEARNQ